MQRDSILETAKARHDAIDAIVRAIEARGRARQRLAEAEANLRAEVANAVFGVGLRQADVANALGWPRQHVHTLLRDERPRDPEDQPAELKPPEDEIAALKAQIAALEGQAAPAGDPTTDTDAPF